VFRVRRTAEIARARFRYGSTLRLWVRANQRTAGFKQYATDTVCRHGTEKIG
jgi:hypothetical protein